MQIDCTTLGPDEFAELVHIDKRRARALTKLKDKRLRPPGFRNGNRYRIWADRLDGYLKDGAFADAMEVVA